MERLLDEFVIAVHNVLRCHALLAGQQRDRHTVLIATADEHNVLFFQAQIAHINVGRNINSGQMADMHTPVGVGQSRCHGGSLELLVCHILYVCFVIVSLQIIVFRPQSYIKKNT